MSVFKKHEIILEKTRTVSTREMEEQLLDNMDLERERGITIFSKQARFSSENCVWELLEDSIDQPILSLPREMESFVIFMEQRQSYCGGNTELTEEFNSFSGFNLVAKSLKQMMNKHRDKLEELGVYFKSSKQNNQRITEIRYVKNTQVRNK